MQILFSTKKRGILWEVETLLFSQFGEARSLAADLCFCVASAKAGVPVLLVAPPSGGKSTVIMGVEAWLKLRGEMTQRVSRIGLKTLKVLTDRLNVERKATLLNEDYALIGSSDYMVEKMGEIIAALSYAHTYQDLGLKIDVTVERVGFISGIQPYWLSFMVQNPVFATHLREKFIRYYMLPMSITQDVDDTVAIKLIAKTLKFEVRAVNDAIPDDFMTSLTLQVGDTRAKRFSRAIANQMSFLSKTEDFERLMHFYAKRLAFEAHIMDRELGENTYTMRSYWQEYTVLYWLLRCGAMTREQIAIRLGVTSTRSVDLAIGKAFNKQWITSYWNGDHKYYCVASDIKRRFMI